MTRILAMTLTATLLAAPAAHAAPTTSVWRGMSDALALPSESALATTLRGVQGRCSAAGRDPSKLQPQTAELIRSMEALLARTPPGDPTRPVYEQTLRKMYAQVQAQPAAAVKPMPTLNAALKSARAWLSTHEARGNKLFAASPDARTVAAASRAAEAASLLGKPGAAVTALLRAHELDPASAQHLTNLGGALLMVGLTPEALGVLDAASTRSSGLNRSAVAANRGLALLRLGRYAEAETTLRPVVTADPALAEARLTLARALTCQGKLTEAARWLRAGSRRTPPELVKMPPSPGTSPGAERVHEIPDGSAAARDGGATMRPSAAVYDLSRGVSTSLPALRLPQTPAEAAALLPQYQKAYAELGERGVALSRRIEALERQFPDLDHTSTLTQRRRANLYRRVINAQLDPGVAALVKATDKSSGEVGTIWTTFFHCQGGCKTDKLPDFHTMEDKRAYCVPLLKADHDRWRSAMHSYAQNLGADLKARTRLRTGLAANISHPGYFEASVLMAEADAVNAYSSLVHAALLWARDVDAFKPECVEGSGASGTTAEVAPPLVIKRPEICKAFLNGMSVAFSVHVLSFEMTCDGVTLGAATPGWIGAFGNIGTTFGSDEYTVVVGIQEGVGIPNTPVSISSSQGVYVTWGEQGVVDAGAAITSGIKVGGGAGPVAGGKDVLSDVSGALSGKWSFIASAGTKP